MQVRDFVIDRMHRVVNVLHKSVLALSGGRLGGRLGPMPVVELHTIGRTSGKRRSTMLTAPVIDGNTVVLVASKGGDDRDPDWYRNLLANPDVELTLDGVTRPMLARPASAEQKGELWPRIVAAYRGYAGYQRRTSRDIPVVICEPR
ncbi:MAG: nitroreductase/quinone reductase family protein [Actinomycetales bacterium]